MTSENIDNQLNQADEWLEKELAALKDTEEEPTQEAQEEPKTSEEVQTTPEVEETSSEGTQEALDESVAETTEEPVKDPIEEFENKYKLEDTEDTEAKKLIEFEAEVKKLEKAVKEADVLAGLPQGGIYSYKGKSIYEMTDNELNEYLVFLSDEGRQTESAYVQNARVKAIDNAIKIHQARQDLTNRQAYLQQMKDTQEWSEVRKNFQQELPMTTDGDYQKVVDWLQNKFDDPVYALKLQTKAGKIQVVAQAIKELKILDQYREADSKAKLIETPSAPEARAGSKKVVNNTKSTSGANSIQELANMSQADFNKLSEEEFDKMMRGS